MAIQSGQVDLSGSGITAASITTKYTYTISTDAANGLVDSDRLAQEIGNSSIIIALDYISVDADTLDIWMKDILSSGDETALDNVVAAHDGTPLAPTPEVVTVDNMALTSEKVLKVEQEPREGDATNFYSPNMCDRTTWYEGCTEVDDFELTDSGDLTTWNTNSTHPGPWCDLEHGKLFTENILLTIWPCKITVDVDAGGVGTWVEKTMNTFDDTDGDYSIDFANGTVTFNSALTSGDKVRASFCKAPTTMTWTMAPASGKRIKLMYAEIQFTTDIELTDDIVYETWVYNPADLPNKVKINEIRYKSISDFLYESTGAYPKITGFGGTGVRGIGNKDVIILPFNYSTFRDMRASQGVEVRIKTNKVHTGTMATSTLYCLQEGE